MGMSIEELVMHNLRMTKRVGASIQRAREEQGLEMIDVARRVDIDPELLYDIEGGNYEVDLAEMRELAYAMRAELSITFTPVEVTV